MQICHTVPLTQPHALMWSVVWAFDFQDLDLKFSFNSLSQINIFLAIQQHLKQENNVWNVCKIN